MDRRRFLLDGLALSAGYALIGCNSNGPRDAQPVLRAAERWNERVERSLFRHRAVDLPAVSAARAGVAFPRYFISRTVPMWNPAVRGPWSLEVTGMVKTPLRLTLAQLAALPSITQRVDHFCVEGWTAIARWSGVRVSTLARLAGMHPGVRAVDFLSFDDGYHESWDLDSAMHPQTLVAYGMDGRWLGPGHGAPARVHSPVKLGYKNTKYLTRVAFLPHRTGGYWSDQGYEWYGGV